MLPWNVHIPCKEPWRSILTGPCRQGQPRKCGICRQLAQQSSFWKMVLLQGRTQRHSGHRQIWWSSFPSSQKKGKMTEASEATCGLHTVQVFPESVSHCLVVHGSIKQDNKSIDVAELQVTGGPRAVIVNIRARLQGHGSVIFWPGKEET